MRTVSTSNISRDEIDNLRQFAREHAGSELSQILTVIGDLLDKGADKISLGSVSEELTPNQVAARLNMSRTHVYKLLDRGEILSHTVGRERRIRMSDLQEFEERREQDRRELAERFARQQETRSKAIDEIAELL